MIQNVLLGLLVLVSFYVGFILTKAYSTLKEINGYDKQKQARDYAQEVQTQKNKKPFLPAIKQKIKGHSITNSEDLVDMADLNWEDGYKAIEELGQ